MTVNWGEVFKAAGPAIGAMAQGKATNRYVGDVNAIQQARDAEDAAVNRARAEVEARTVGVAEQKAAQDAEMQAIRNAMLGRMMQNMGDVSFSGNFRSNVPKISFSGGSRPSALGADRGELGALLNHRAMQSLMTPPQAAGGGGSQAVPRNQGVMPAYQPAQTSKGGGFWENALGVAGLGASIAGAAMQPRPSVAGTVAKAAAPAAAEAGANYIGNAIRNTAGKMPGAGISNAALAGADVATKAPTSFWSGVNSAAGPIAMGVGLAAPFLPAGKARTAADWASKGAQVGSFIPGVGTGIGAAAGAVAGAIKGHQNATKPQREDFAKRMGYRSLHDLNQALAAMGPEGQELKRVGENVVGKHDFKGNQRWLEQTAMLLGRR